MTRRAERDNPPSGKRQRRTSCRRLIAGVTTLATTAAFASGEGTQPAGAEPQGDYAVAHTDGDGVWLHGQPGFQGESDLITILPEGTPIDVTCYVTSDPVGTNPYWLQVITNTGQEGFITDAYSSTVWSSDNTLADQGFSDCNAPGPNNTNYAVPHKAVFYAPGNGETVWYDGRDVPMPVPENVYVMAAEGEQHPRWTSSTECHPASAGDWQYNMNWQYVRTLAGWSIGRLGPIYFLRNGFGPARDQIDQIILIDPGSREEYEGNRCDQQQSEILKQWLLEGDENELLVLAGTTTEDANNPTVVDGQEYRHAGIQNVLFSAIRGNAELTDQVLVCNYSLGHVQMFDAFRGVLGQYFVNDVTRCPTTPEGTSGHGWRP